MSYRLYAAKQCGSAVVEALLAIADAEWELEELDFDSGELLGEDYRQVNPLAQVPALVLPDGPIITESAAIILTLVERFPEAGLAPPAGTDARAEFYRWLAFLAVNVYGEMIHGDHPERYVDGEDASAAFTKRSDTRARGHLATMEAALEPAPFLLGERMTALDPYLAMMRHWRPGPGWFAEACPKLEAAAQAAEAHPQVAAAWRRQGWT